MYKLVKEIGKFVQNFRTFTAEATSSIENNLESQLQLEEIRKAQRELNEAFSFRRSINVEADSDPFEVNAQSPRMPEQTELGSSTMAAAAATTTTTPVATAKVEEKEETVVPKKKIRRRRIKKKVEVPVDKDNEEEEEQDWLQAISDNTTNTTVTKNIPDLSMEEEDDMMSESEENAAKSLREANEQLRQEAMEEEAAERRKERMERLQTSATLSEEEMDVANARFQAQLSGNWNNQILSKGEELNPMANIMDRLALLEQEKQAADERLQQEFRLREENEERFYREKRKLLEEAAAQVQAEVYFNPNGVAASKAGSNSTTITKA